MKSIILILFLAMAIASGQCEYGGDCNPASYNAENFVDMDPTVDGPQVILPLVYPDPAIYNQATEITSQALGAGPGIENDIWWASAVMWLNEDENNTSISSINATNKTIL